MKSISGSKQSSESLKPFWPDALPWQPPLLHPSFVNTGTTELVKLSGRFSPMLLASSGTFTVLSPKVAVISLDPLARGRTRPNVVIAAVFPSATTYCTS